MTSLRGAKSQVGRFSLNEERVAIWMKAGLQTSTEFLADPAFKHQDCNKAVYKARALPVIA